MAGGKGLYELASARCTSPPKAEKTVIYNCRLNYYKEIFVETIKQYPHLGSNHCAWRVMHRERHHRA